MPAGQVTPTTPIYGAKIMTVDPTQGIVEILLKGEAQTRRAIVYTTSIAFRWPVVGEAWMVHNINNTWYLDSPWPNADATTSFNDVNPGDVILNSPSGTIHIIGSATSPPEDYSLNPPTPWSGIAYAASWGDAGAPWAVGQYSRNPLGEVLLRGVAAKSANWTLAETIATLPIGYRPAANELFCSATQDATAGAITAQIKITTTGTIILYKTVPVVGVPAHMSSLSLSGIVFSTS